jgi:hypothetical protein
MKNEREIMKSINKEEIKNLLKEKPECKNKLRKIRLSIKKYLKYKYEKRKND